jgi:tetraacyldisaccharide 4'-kinase
MRAPAFWSQSSLLSDLLLPAGDLYAAAGWLRGRRARPQRAPVPVICVGNLVAGGAGKTPTALALLERLKDRGLRPAALLRGYGGTLAGPVKVALDSHGPEEVGDEALLLACAAPTWVARDRVAGARAAAAEGANVLVLDDGFQNPHLAKDLSLLVLDGETGLGNGRVIPAGPLREPARRGIARADALVILGEDRHGLAHLAAGKPVLRAQVQPRAGLELPARRLLAFAGIGRPAKFFATLERLGGELTATAEFADHHPFTAAELQTLERRAVQQRAALITTEKDAVRLPPGWRGRVAILPVELSFAEPRRLDALLDRVLPAGSVPDA